MVAGAGTILMQNGPDCTIAQPYVGVAPQSVRGLAATPKWVLTVENLTTFHLAAEALKGRDDGLVVFTGGMPSPAWVAAFRRLTGQLPSVTIFYHWGDIDVGGFRIAARLQQSAMPEGASVRPWLMDVVHHGRGEEVSDSTRDAMRLAALRAGWIGFGNHPAMTLEQERVEVVLPGQE